MDIITWNVQACTGVDGREDISRICEVIEHLGGADVICLQEVASHMLESGEKPGLDQVLHIAEQFPEHEAFFGAAIDLRGVGRRRQRFGNLVLSRLPVAQCFRHSLPRPPEPGVLHMPRQATEVVVETQIGALRVTTTHLEFHSAAQRLSQTRRLLEIQDEIRANEREPPLYAEDGPYAHVPRPGQAILCGDFNFTVNDEPYRLMTGGTGGESARFFDAWRRVHADREHAPTCGIFDREQWPQGPHCRDFFFVTEDLAAAVDRFEVDTTTDASDHQPLKLGLSRK